MSRAKLKMQIEIAGCTIVPMSEHDLLEVVEIEETTGLSQMSARLRKSNLRMALYQARL